MKTKLPLSAFIAACLLPLAAQTVQAQDAPAATNTENPLDDLYSLSLEQLLEMTVTTGSFLDLDLRTSSVSMTIITAEQLETSGARHLSEALEIYVPGFQYVINKWNGIIWGLRGVSTDRNNKIIFLVNGHKMNAESRDGAMSELDLGLLGDIKRIEVLRGPAGLVYGSGAIAGVVNVVTQNYESDGARASMKSETWGMRTYGHEAQLSLGRKLGENASVKVDLGTRVSEGVGSEVSRLWGRPQWPYPQWKSNPPANGVPSVGSAKSTPGNYKAAVDMEVGKLRLYTRWTHQVTNASGWYPVDAWPEISGNPDSKASSRMIDGKKYDYKSIYGSFESYGENRRQYVIDNIIGMAEYKISMGLNELKLKAGFDGLNDIIQREEMKGYEKTASEERNTVVLEQFGERRYSLGATYMFNASEKYQAAVGVEGSIFDLGKDMNGINSQNEKATHPIITDVVYRYGSIFGEGVYHVTPKLDAHVGLRFDGHTRTIDQGGVLSPKIAGVYKIGDKHSVKMIYQQSSNNGSADNYEFNRNLISDNGEPYSGDTYHYTDPTKHQNVIPPVTEEILHQLKPERSQSIEIVGFFQPLPQLIVEPSISYNTISDMFAWNQTYMRVVNAGKYSFASIDLNVQYVTPKLTVGACHTIQKLVKIDLANMKISKIDIKSQDFTAQTPVFNDNSYDSTLVGDIWHFTPKALKTKSGADSMQTVVNNYVRDGVTVDGSNFLSIPPHSTKIYAIYKPADWVSLQANARIFWGLQGRTPIQEFDPKTNTDPILKDVSGAISTANQYPYLDIDSEAIFRVNAGVVLGSPESRLKVSLYGYDLLGGNGTGRNLNSVRWGQMFDLTASDLYGMEYRSFAIKVNYSL